MALGFYAQNAAFSYQGLLLDGAKPANGIYDLQFRLADAAAGGNYLGLPEIYGSVPVSNGLFTVTLDFGASAFGGSARWLEVAVRTNFSGTFTTLMPRQQLTATPYAITAASVSGTVSASQVNGPLSTDQLPGTVLTNGSSASGLANTSTQVIQELQSSNALDLAGVSLNLTNLVVATALYNSAASREQTNSVILTNGTIALPGAFQADFDAAALGTDLGGKLAWFSPTDPFALGFITTFESWGSSDPLYGGNQWMQLGAQNIRLEPGWGTSPHGHGGGMGDVVLGNELGYTRAVVNYSLGTNLDGVALSTPLTFIAHDPSHYEEPGIQAAADPNSTGPMNNDGAVPGELWFYSLAPTPLEPYGYIDTAVVTARMHTNTWEFSSGVAIDASPVASWPTQATAPNQVLLVVSNTTLYSLHTALNSTTWAATNKLAGP